MTPRLCLSEEAAMYVFEEVAILSSIQ